MKRLTGFSFPFCTCDSDSDYFDRLTEAQVTGLGRCFPSPLSHLQILVHISYWGKAPFPPNPKKPCSPRSQSLPPSCTHSLPALMPPHMVSVQIDSSAYASSLWCCPCMRQLRQARSMSAIHTPFSFPSRVHVSIQKCLCPIKTMLPRLESIK